MLLISPLNLDVADTVVELLNLVAVVVETENARIRLMSGGARDRFAGCYREERWA